MIIIGILEDFLKEKFKSLEFINCPKCGSCFTRFHKGYERKPMSSVYEGGKRLILQVERIYCKTCGQTSSIQPKTCVKGKQFTKATIEDFLELRIKGKSSLRFTAEHVSKGTSWTVSHTTVMRQQEDIADNIPTQIAFLQKSKDYIFSGILCLDEVFFTNCGKKVCGLIAIDSKGPYLLGFKITKRRTKEEIKGFLEEIKGELEEKPVGVVTDGWKGYPETIYEVFPEASHQLCKVHIARDIVKSAVKYKRRLEQKHIKPIEEAKKEAIKGLSKQEKEKIGKLYNTMIEMDREKIERRIEEPLQELLDSLFAPNRYLSKRIFESLESRPWLYENTPFEGHIKFINQNWERITAHYLDSRIPSTNNACENYAGFFRRHQYGKGLRSKEKGKSGWFKLVGVSFNFRQDKNWIENILLEYAA